jgi:hypothetical protein
MTFDLTPAITALFGIVGAGAAYLFTKSREREAEWRKDKREYYKAFVASLSETLENETTPEGPVAFRRATNDLNLIAPQRVVDALITYRHEISISNPHRDAERENRLLSRLLFEMRRDLAMSPKDDEATFRVVLWAAGIAPARQELQTEESRRPLKGS